MDPVFPSWLKLDLPPFLQPVGKYMWQLFAQSTQLSSSLSKTLPTEFELIMGEQGTFAISKSFQPLLNGRIDEVSRLYNLPLGLDQFAKAEPLACCFYLINSLHEHLLPAHLLDRYGRYPWKESIQYHNNITHRNYCQEIFDSLFLSVFSQSAQQKKTTIFWSHDIDYLHSEWKVDILLGWRNKSIQSFWQGIKKILQQKSNWNNIDQILQIEKQYNLLSTFFFLTERGKSKLSTGHKIDHADYSIASTSMRNTIASILQHGSHIGLHKSAFEKEIKYELQQMPPPINANRNHFLHFQLPNHYDKIQQSGLKYDCSLGFAEQPGFRNSYGLPFHPFNIKENKPYSFIEIPLQIMDATYIEYLGLNEQEMQQDIVTFLQKNQHNSVISILLHNTRMDLKSKKSLAHWHRFYANIQELNFECFH